MSCEHNCSTHGANHSLCSSACGCCCNAHHHHDHDHWCEFPEQLLELADEAWMELLKEKIKQQIEQTSGKRLNELAKLVNQTNHDRWNNIFVEKHSEDSYKEKLREFFHQPDNKSKR